MSFPQSREIIKRGVDNGNGNGKGKEKKDNLIQIQRLCSSDKVLTTQELRKLVTDASIPGITDMDKTSICKALGKKYNQVFQIREESVQIPDAFIDKVSLEIMKEPIVANDGHSYDKETLHNYFIECKRTNTIPYSQYGIDDSIILLNPFKDINLKTTGKTSLIPNRYLAQAIRDWKIQHGFKLEEGDKKSICKSSSSSCISR